MAKKTGRPSGYSEAAAERVCALLIEGMTLRQIERQPDMPARTTILRWLAQHEGFRIRYAHAREMQAEHLADEILEIADDGSNDWTDRERQDGSVDTVVDHEHISRSKLRVDARKWLMAKMAPKKYGEKVEHELGGKDGGPITLIERVIVRPKDTEPGDGTS